MWGFFFPEKMRDCLFLLYFNSILNQWLDVWDDFEGFSLSLNHGNELLL